IFNYVLFFIYLKNIRNILFESFIKEKEEKKINKKYYKIYIKKRNAYLRKMRKFIKKKKIYSMDYFKKRINKKPELLQTEKFNRKIVKYRAESIYRITQNSIRPNQRLNKLI